MSVPSSDVPKSNILVQFLRIHLQVAASPRASLLLPANCSNEVPLVLLAQESPPCAAHYLTVLSSYSYPCPSVKVDQNEPVVIVGNSVHTAVRLGSQHIPLISLDLDVFVMALTTSNVTAFDLPARLKVIDTRRSLVNARVNRASLIDDRPLDRQPNPIFSRPLLAPSSPAAGGTVSRGRCLSYARSPLSPAVR